MSAKINWKMSSSYAVCCISLHALLINKSLEANSVDPDQNGPRVVWLELQCLSKRLLKQLSVAIDQYCAWWGL